MGNAHIGQYDNLPKWYWYWAISWLTWYWYWAIFIGYWVSTPKTRFAGKETSFRSWFVRVSTTKCRAKNRKSSAFRIPLSTDFWKKSSPYHPNFLEIHVSSCENGDRESAFYGFRYFWTSEAQSIYPDISYPIFSHPKVISYWANAVAILPNTQYYPDILISISTLNPKREVMGIGLHIGQP